MKPQKTLLFSVIYFLLLLYSSGIKADGVLPTGLKNLMPDQAAVPVNNPPGIWLQTFINCNFYSLLSVYQDNSGYCSPIPSFDNACQMWISKITSSGGISDLNHDSGCAGSSYFDFSCTDTLSNTQLSYTALTFESAGYAMAFSVWIDLNNDYVFDISERVIAHNNPGGDLIVTDSFMIPLSVSPGTYRMRVRGDFYGNGAPADPCDQLHYGETEDYSFTVLAAVPCTGPANPGNTFTDLSVVCPADTFTVSLQYHVDAFGITYQWQSSQDGVNWTDLASDTTDNLMTSQPAPSYYRCTVNCSCDSSTGFSNPVHIQMNDLVSCYCVPAISDAACDYEWISNITSSGGETNINNSTGCSSWSYADFSSSDTLSGFQYEQIFMTFTSYGYALAYAVWIDFNDNGIYENPEKVISEDNPYEELTITAQFSVPGYALPGAHTMRVRGEDYGYEAPADPCNQLYYGETEDYTFNVLPALQKDVKLLSIVNPDDIGYQSAAESVIVHLKNNGYDTLYQIPITYVLNDKPPVSYTWNGLLLPQQKTNVILPPVMPEVLNNTITVYTGLPGDMDHTNDTLSSGFFALSPPALISAIPDTVFGMITSCDSFATQTSWLSLVNVGFQPLYYSIRHEWYENFENGLNNWSSDDNWSVAQGYTGAYGLTEGPSGNYENYWKKYIQLKDSLYIADKDSFGIQFMVKLNLDTWNDYLSPQISVNGGLWYSVADLTGTGEWNPVKIPLSSYVENGDYIKFRFMFESYGSAEFEGAVIDELKINGVENKWASLSQTRDTIAAGDTSSVEIIFTVGQLTAGIHTQNLIIESNDPLTSIMVVPLYFIVTGLPQILVKDSVKIFPSIQAGQSAEESFMIYNIGCDTLKITAVNNTDPAFNPVYPSCIAGRDSALIVVKFFSLAQGIHNDTLIIQNNSETIKLYVSGIILPAAYLTLNPDSISMSTAVCEDTVNGSFQLINSGNDTMRWNVYCGEDAGTAMSFNGSTSEVRFGDMGQMPQKGCVEFWMKTNVGSGSRRVFSTSGLNGNWKGVNIYQSGSYLFLGIGDDNGASGSYTITNNVDYGHWHHVAVTWDVAQNKVWAYFNGIVNVNGDYNSHWPSAFSDVRLGIGYSASASYYFNGEVDGFRMWKENRSASEIMDLYHEGLSVPLSGLAGWWEFNEPSGDTVYSLNSGIKGVLYNITRVSSGAGITDPQTDANPASGILAGGDTAVVQVNCFTGGFNSGIHNAVVGLTTNDPLHHNVFVPVQMVISGTSQVFFTDSIRAFPSILAGDLITDTFKIFNTGCDSLKITAVNNTDPSFSADFSTFVIPGDSGLITVSFSSLTQGLHADTLTILNNSESKHLYVSGVILPTPKLTLVPGSLSNNTNICDDTLSNDFTIINAGNDTLTWEAYYTDGAGKALSFNGSNSEVHFGDLGLMPEKGSVEFWMKTNVNTGSRKVFSSSGLFNNWKGVNIFQNGAGLYLRMGDDAGNSYFFTVTDNVQFGTWHHVAVTWDKTQNKVWTYFDGNVYENGSNNPRWVSAFSDARLGVGYAATTANHFSGEIDEFRLWSENRSAADIMNLYREGIFDIPVSLTGLWEFNEPSGDTVYSLNSNIKGILFYTGRVTSGAGIRDAGIDALPVSGLLAPNDTAHVAVTLNTAGYSSGTNHLLIGITTNDPLHLLDFIPLQLVLDGAPQIVFNDTTEIFPSIMAGAVVSDTFKIFNSGCDSLKITAVNNDDPAFTPGFPTFVLPKDSGIITVIFSSQIQGYHSDTLIIMNNSEPRQLYVSGTILQTPHLLLVPDSLSVSTGICEDTLSTALQIINTGNAAMSWSAYCSDGAGKSVSFNGSTSEVRFGDLGLMPDKGCIEFWMKTNVNSGTKRVFCSSGLNGTYKGINIYQSGTILYLRVGDDAGNYYVTHTITDNVDFGNWHHVAVTWDKPQNKLWAYFDGNVAVDDTYNPEWPLAFSDVRLGVCYNTTSTYRFNGEIDGFRLWSEIRSEADINDFYHEGIFDPPASLTGLWEFNEPSGDTAYSFNSGIKGVLLNITRVSSGALISNPGIDADPVDGTVAVGDTASVVVTFVTGVLNNGTHHSVIGISTDDPLQHLVVVPTQVILTGLPCILIRDSVAVFPSVEAGDSAIKTFMIYNTGCDSLKISAVNNGDPAFVPVYPSVILPKDSALITVGFYSLVQGLHCDTLTILNNNGTRHLYVCGTILPTAQLLLVPDSLSAVTGSCNDTIISNFQVINTGNDTMNWSAYFSHGAGNALSFNGSNSEVHFGDLGPMPEQGCVEFWMKTNVNAANKIIFSSSGINSTWRGVIIYQNYNYLYIRMGDDNGDYNSYVISNDIDYGQWHHVAITWDISQNKVWAYFDGNVTKNGSANIYFPSAFSDVRLGIGYYSSTTYHYNGEVDGFRMWSEYRSGEEITNSFRLGMFAPPPGLIGAWEFNEPSGDTVYSFNNDKTGILINVTRVASEAGILDPGIDLQPAGGQIADGDTSAVQVTFVSSILNSGTHISAIGITTNDPLHPYAFIPTWLVLNGYPQIMIYDSIGDLPSVMAGEAATDTFQIFNTGCDTLKITSLTHTDSAFTIIYPDFVMPRDTALIIADFYSLIQGIYHDTITIQSNSGIRRLFAGATVIVTPGIALTPDSIIVSTNNCHDTIVTTINVINTGNDTLLCSYYFSETLSDNFDAGIDYFDWSEVLNGTSAAWCGTAAGTGALYFDGTGTREIITKSLNTVGGGTISFHLMIATGTSPCDNADAGEDIVLEYSVDNGSTWVVIQIFDSENYPGFTAVQIPIPAAAQNVQTLFRWRQIAHSGSGNDNWAIDEVNINGTTGSWAILSDTSNMTIPGDTSQIDITFFDGDLSSGNYFQNLIIESNVPASPILLVPLCFSISGQPQILIEDSIRNFPTIYAGATTTDTFMIYNTGCDSLKITAINHSDQAFTPAFPSFVMPYDSALITVGFYSLTLGFHSDTLSVLNNSEIRRLYVNGTITAGPELAVTPDSIPMSASICDDTLYSLLQVKNSGFDTLNWNSDVTRGADKALFFNGSNSEVVLGDFGPMPPKGCIEFWMKTNSISGQRGIVSTSGLNSNWKGINIYQNNNYIYLRFGNDFGNYYATYAIAENADAGHWHHVAVTWDITQNKVWTYFDGNMSTNGSYNSYWPSAITDVRFGVGYNATSRFYGEMDEVRMWSEYRTAIEIANLYQEPYIATLPELLGIWEFNEPAGGTAFSVDHCKNGILFNVSRVVSGADINRIGINVTPESGSLTIGDSINVQISFITSGLNNGSHYGGITVLSNDPFHSAAVIPVHLVLSGASQIQLPETDLFMDVIIAGASVTDSVPVVSYGCDTLIITGITNNNTAFTFDQTSFTIVPGHTAYLKVTFEPVDVGVYEDTVQIISDGGNARFFVHAVALTPPSASVSISCASFDPCMDSMIICNAVPLNGGSNPLFKWYVNDILMQEENQINDGDIFSYTPADNDSVLCVMTSNMPYVINNPDTSNTITITLPPQAIPDSAGTISGWAGVCQGKNNVTYTIPVIANAVSYIWSLPSGATGTSSTNSITVNYSDTAVSGNITVKGHNLCQDGAESFLAVTVNPLPAVNAGTDTVIGQGSAIVLNGSISGGTLPYMILWTPSGSLSDNDILNPLASPVSSTTYTLTVSDAHSCSASDKVHIHVTYLTTGSVVYGNSLLTPMQNEWVYFEDAAHILIDSVLTSGAGNYYFDSITEGTYYLYSKPSYMHGGISATDALLIKRHIVNLAALSGINLNAADVNNSHTILSTDALLILRRTIGLIPSFAAGDWTSEMKVLTVNSNQQNVLIKVLCMGDVNGSYNIYNMKKAEGSPVLTCKPVSANLIAGETFNLPIKVDQNILPGAVTLNIRFPEDIIDITGVLLNGSEIEYYVYNGILSVAAYDVNGMQLENNVLLTLKCKIKPETKKTDICISLTEQCEIADREGYVIKGLLLEVAQLNVTENFIGFKLEDNVPNPFSETTMVRFYIPEEASADVSVINMQGVEIKTISFHKLPAGWNEIQIDGKELSHGVYFYRLHAAGAQQTFEETRRMMIVR